MRTISQRSIPTRQSRGKQRQPGWKRLWYALGCSLLFGNGREDTTSAYPEGFEKTSGHSSSSSTVTDNTLSKTTHEPQQNQIEQPKRQKALVVARKGEYELCHEMPMPHVGDDEVMIRTVAVGLNPIDWKSVDYNFCLPEFPWITGREMSGVVAAVGSKINNWKTEDKVWTSTYYRDKRAGCFQEFVVVPSHTVNRIPESLSFEEAACLGVAALTASMTLWRWLGVPNTPKQDSITGQGKPDWLLIWGGSTVTGQFATQLAAHSGLKVITVNSHMTKDISYKLGASHVVVRDGRTNEELVDEIRNVTGGRVTRAVDLVGPKTAALTLQAVSTTEPVQFAPLAMMANDQAVPTHVNAHTVEMKQYVLDPACQTYAQRLNELIDQGCIKMPDMTVMAGGLDSVVQGLELLKKGNMAGRKLIVTV